MSWVRRARRALSVPAGDHAGGVFARHDEAWHRARTLVGTYDWLHLAFVAQAVRWLPRIVAGEPRLLWPVAWLDWTGVEKGAPALYLAATAAALGAVVAARPRLLRFLAWLGFVLLVALDSSFGKITHSWQAWSSVGLCLCWFDSEPDPRGGSRRTARQRALVVFWLAQALVLLFYSLTGFWKVVGIVVQASRGEVTALSASALPIHVAHAALIARSTAVGASFVMAHRAIAGVLFLAVLYLELFSWVVAFRPALQRCWALCLIAFHLGVYLVMDLDFTSQALVDALLFLRSPFATGGFRVSAVWASLPVLGLPARAWLARGRRRS